MNNQLAICIPTYNRAEVLEELLKDLIPKIVHYSIPIYISDNSSQDHTEQVVQNATHYYQFIFYHKNDANLGADKNFESVLKMSQCDYSWLLGDDDRIVAEGITEILSIINQEKFDVIVTNGCNFDKSILKCQNIQSTKYVSHNELMLDLWHTMTWMSTLIYSKDLINCGNFSKYYNTNFLQSAVIFDYLGHKQEFNVYWNSVPLVVFPEENKIVNHYTDKLIFLFIKCWVDVLQMLPSSYSKETKYKCMQYSPISFSKLIVLRAQKRFSFKQFIEYRSYFKYAMETPFSLIFLISITPTIFLKFIYFIYVLVKK